MKRCVDDSEGDYCTKCGADKNQICLKQPTNDIYSIKRELVSVRWWKPAEGSSKLQYGIKETSITAFGSTSSWIKWYDVPTFQAFTIEEQVSYRLLNPHTHQQPEDEFWVVDAREYLERAKSNDTR